MLNFEIFAVRWRFFLAAVNLFQFVQALFSAEGLFYFWLNTVSSTSHTPTLAKCVGRTTSAYCCGTGMTMVGAHLLEFKVGDIASSCVFCVNGERRLPPQMKNWRFYIFVAAGLDSISGREQETCWYRAYRFREPPSTLSSGWGSSGWGMVPTT